MKLNLAYNILISSAITKSVVYGHQAAPHTRSLGTSTMEEDVGDGCRTNFDFFSRTITQDGTKCVTSTLCEDSHTNSMFVPTTKDTCVEFSEDESECSVFELVTSFKHKWCMKHVTLKASKMDSSFDPKSIKVLASNDKINWTELFSAEVEFQNRDEGMECIMKNEDDFDHYAIQFEKLNKMMHIGKLGLVESYTRKCAADLYYKITGTSLPLYETMAPTSLPTITPTSRATSHDFTNDGILRQAVDLWLADSSAAESTYGHIKDWGVGKVINMKDLFNGKGGVTACAEFNDDISLWDTSQVTAMTNLFMNCPKFNSDISRWNISLVETIRYMFGESHVFNQDLSAWNTHRVTNMVLTFHKAHAFNQDISTWNVSAVTDMGGMFQRTAFNQDISSWHTSAVTDMNHMFAHTKVFNYDLSAWDISAVTNMSFMFREVAMNRILCWDTSNANTNNMFYESPGSVDPEC